MEPTLDTSYKRNFKKFLEYVGFEEIKIDGVQRFPLSNHLFGFLIKNQVVINQNFQSLIIKNYLTSTKKLFKKLMLLTH